MTRFQHQTLRIGHPVGIFDAALTVRAGCCPFADLFAVFEQGNRARRLTVGVIPVIILNPVHAVRLVHGECAVSSRLVADCGNVIIRDHDIRQLFRRSLCDAKSLFQHHQRIRRVHHTVSVCIGILFCFRFQACDAEQILIHNNNVQNVHSSVQIQITYEWRCDRLCFCRFRSLRRSAKGEIIHIDKIDARVCLKIKADIMHAADAGHRCCKILKIIPAVCGGHIDNGGRHCVICPVKGRTVDTDLDPAHRTRRMDGDGFRRRTLPEIHIPVDHIIAGGDPADHTAVGSGCVGMVAQCNIHTIAGIIAFRLNAFIGAEPSGRLSTGRQCRAKQR